MRYLIDHELRLAFATPVREHHCEVRLAPSSSATQQVSVARLLIEPAAEVHGFCDYFGNRVHAFDVVAPHTQLVARLHVEVETLLHNPFAYTVIAPARERDWIADTLKSQPWLWDYVLHRSNVVPPLTRLAADRQWPAYDPQHAVLDAVLAATEWVADTLAYRSDLAAAGVLAEALKAGSGCCHDLAHLLIAIVRAWGVPARFVGGYQDPDYLDEADDAQPAPHGWAEVLIPGAGWRGFDPTTRLVTNDTYVTAVVGRDAGDTTAYRDTLKGDDAAAVPDVTLRLQRQQDAQQ